jgi:hypothetical protein
MNRRWMIAIAMGAVLHMGGVAAADGVRGVVELRSGARLQNAKVIFCPVQMPSNCRTTFTGSDGGFSLNIPGGKYSVRVQSYQGKTFDAEPITIGSNASPLRIVVP